MWNRLKSKIFSWRYQKLTSVAITAVILILQYSQALQLIECAILDMWFRLRLPDAPESRIVIVTISEEDIALLGGWPISDAILARLLKNIKQQQPRVIGLNLYRNFPVEPGHQQLLDVYASTPNLIGINKILNSTGELASTPPLLLNKKNQIAASDIILDPDGRVRRSLLSLHDSQDKTILTLGTKLALMYLEKENIEFIAQDQQGTLKVGKAIFFPLKQNESGYVGADVGGYQIFTNINKIKGGFSSISINNVLRGDIPANLMQERIVLIGSISESASERFYTPYTTDVNTAWFGVQIHANIASQILSAALDGKQILKGIPEPLEWLWIFWWSYIGAAIGWWTCRSARISLYQTSPKLRAKYLFIKALIPFSFTCISLIICSYLFFLMGYWLIVAAPFLACVASGFVSFGHRLWKSLEIYHRRLIYYTQTLEYKVKERTQELQEKNIALEKAKEGAEEAQKNAETANRSKSTFLANMSHELRTPLNAILGFTQIISSDSDLPECHHKNLEIVNRSGEHLLSLINDILEISKIEAGRIVLNLVNFDLISLLRNVEQMFKLKANSKGLDLIFEIAPNIPQYIETDERKLHQVLINILGNAIKFTERGIIKVSVSLADKDKQEVPTSTQLIHFEISDTGSGISFDDKERIFLPFEQVENGTTSNQGTGLGLAISKQFILLMGGDIKVCSQLNQGSSFSFYIQANIPEALNEQIPKLTQRVIYLAPNQPEYRILIADDHAESRQFMVQLFSSIGFQVKTAENGSQAISAWSIWNPHLILMDMQMPIMNGKEACKHIKSHSQGQTTTIFALTANTFIEDENLARLSGFDEFISKPVQTNILLEKVKTCLGLSYTYKNSTETASLLEKHNQDQIIPLMNADLHMFLSQMPASWLKNLAYAASTCNDNLIFRLTKELSPEQTLLIQTINNLANEFQFDKILELVELAKRMF
jgi:adenylate cyclase